MPKKSAANMSIEDIVNGRIIYQCGRFVLVCSLHSHVNLYLVGINSRDENKELTATKAVWKSIKVEMTSHFIITNTNLFVIPKLIEFLSRVNKYVVFLTGFTNIAS
jgi:hypothetical protein